MISEQTYMTLVREHQENATACIIGSLALHDKAHQHQQEANRLMEEWARQQRIEQRQSKGR